MNDDAKLADRNGSD